MREIFTENYRLITNLIDRESPMKKMLLISIFIASSIACAQGQQDSLINRFQPGDHELLLMPTAYTMDAGQAYFSDYEIVLLNLGWAATPRTHLGVMFLFPITADFLQTVTLGAKQNYIQLDQFQAALWGSYTIKNGLYTAGNVFSIGKKSTSLHIGIALAGETEKSSTILLLLAGGRLDLSRKVSGFLEYSNAKEFLDEDFNGIITIGIRFRSESAAWELAGFRPLESTGDLLFLPLLKATFMF